MGRQRTYLCIDLKSFYASIECMDEHLAGGRMRVSRGFLMGSIRRIVRFFPSYRSARRVRSRTGLCDSEGFGETSPASSWRFAEKQNSLFCMCVITHALLATLH